MTDLSRATSVLNALMAGSPAEEVERDLEQLDPDERQTLLCTACYLMNEVRVNCEQRAEEIAAILRRNSRCYPHGSSKCDQAEVLRYLGS